MRAVVIVIVQVAKVMNNNCIKNLLNYCKSTRTLIKKQTHLHLVIQVDLEQVPTAMIRMYLKKVAKTIKRSQIKENIKIKRIEVDPRIEKEDQRRIMTITNQEKVEAEIDTKTKMKKMIGIKDHREINIIMSLTEGITIIEVVVERIEMFTLLIILINH